MWSPFPSRSAYQALKNEVDIELDSTESLPLEPLQFTASSRKLRITSVIIGTILATAALIALLLHIASSTQRAESANEAPPPSVIPTESTIPKTSASKCQLRREWRTLNAVEQSHYISSVKCLTTIPSTMRLSSLYEDFPWIHSHIGYFTHNSAPFLPWHRYFLHIYETSLREHCNYTGSLVYWDWTKDWEHLQDAPVFNPDPEIGFGTDGAKDGEITVGRTGRCVVDGAFKDIKPSFYDVKLKPHCLSRGFRDDEGHLGIMDGKPISPVSIDEILDLKEYEKFVKLMESMVHDTIPFGIGGDFETFTAPYDPLFYLHHTQLDRLWWLWQQKDPKKRLNAYGGHAQRHSIEMASLSDPIKMGALAPGIQVSDVMITENDLLCYRYE